MPTRGPDPTVTDERLLLEFVLNSGPAFFASEFEDELPLSRQQIASRLDRLESEGFVTSKHASGRRLWWLTQKGKDRVADEARRLFQSLG